MDDIMSAIGGDMNISNAQSLGPSIASAGIGEGGLDDIFGTGSKIQSKKSRNYVNFQVYLQAAQVPPVSHRRTFSDSALNPKRTFISPSPSPFNDQALSLH